MIEPLTHKELERIREKWDGRIEVINLGGGHCEMQAPPEVWEVMDLIEEVDRLRALTTITGEMIERAAIQMCATDRQSSIWPILTESEREEFRADARAVLAVAFGGDAATSARSTRETRR